MKVWDLAAVQQFVLRSEVSVPCKTCQREVFFKPVLVLFPMWNDAVEEFQVAVIADACYSGQSCICDADPELLPEAKTKVQDLLNRSPLGREAETQDKMGEMVPFN